MAEKHPLRRSTKKQRNEEFLNALSVWPEIPWGSNDEVMSLGDLAAKLKAFGFHTIELADGNDIEAVVAALNEPTTPGKPKAILAHTVKGKGVSYMENQVGWHGKAQMCIRDSHNNFSSF